MRSRPTLVLICAAAALALGAAALTWGLKVKADLSFFLPDDGSTVSRLVAGQLREGPTAGLLLLAVAGGAADQRRAASDRLTRRLVESGAFVFAANGTPRVDKADLDALREHRYVLNPPLQTSDLSAEALREKLTRALELLRTSFAAPVKRLLPSDPTLRTLDVAEHLAAFGARSGGNGPWESKDGARALIVALPRGETFDFATARRTLGLIDREFAEIAAGSDLRLERGGPGVIALDTRDRIKAEAQWLSAVSTVLVGALLLLAYRSFLALATVFLPIACALISGAAAVQVVFGHVHGVTFAFGSILIGVAVDYPIHVLTHGASGDGARGAITRIWPTIRLGVLTTVVGFGPMFFSGFAGLSQLGVFAVAGLLAAAAATRWVVPATAPATIYPALLKLDVFRQRNIAIGAWAPVAAGLAATAAAVFLAASGGRVWDDDPRRLSPIPPDKLAFDRSVRADIGAPDVRRFIVVKGASAEAVLVEQEALAPRLDAVLGTAGRYDLAARYLPSLRARAERKALLPTPAELRANLERALVGLPFQAGLFAPFLSDVERVRTAALLPIDALAKGPLGWRVSPLLFQRDGEWVGLITLAGVSDPAPVADVVASLDRPSVAFVDLKRESDRLMAEYRREALLWLAGGAVAAVLILAVGMRSLTEMFRVALPVFASVVLTASLLFAAGGPLTLIHVMALLLVAGLGLDYALFLNRNFQSRDDARTTAASVALGNITTIAVFAVLAFSQLPVLNSMGRTVAIGAVLSILLASLCRRRQFAD